MNGACWFLNFTNLFPLILFAFFLFFFRSSPYLRTLWPFCSLCLMEYRHSGDTPRYCASSSSSVINQLRSNLILPSYPTSWRIFPHFSHHSIRIPFWSDILVLSWVHCSFFFLSIASTQSLSFMQHLLRNTWQSVLLRWCIGIVWIQSDLQSWSSLCWMIPSDSSWCLKHVLLWGLESVLDSLSVYSDTPGFWVLLGCSHMTECYQVWHDLPGSFSGYHNHIHRGCIVCRYGSESIGSWSV